MISLRGGLASPWVDVQGERRAPTTDPPTQRKITWYISAAWPGVRGQSPRLGQVWIFAVADVLERLDVAEFDGLDERALDFQRGVDVAERAA